MDIGWAQELFGSADRISSILILLNDDSQVEAVADALGKIVPADARVALPAARSEEMKSMLGAFQLNITAMSLVSLVVGMFLICNSVGVSVIRRRVEIAILRANGATRGEVRRLFLCEAALEAAAGVALGIWLAPLLAGWIAQPVSQSVSSLYELVRIENLSLTHRQMLEAVVIGMAAALIAAWLPASEAAHCEPARILHPGFRHRGVLAPAQTGIGPGRASDWRGLRALCLFPQGRLQIFGLRCGGGDHRGLLPPGALAGPRGGSLLPEFWCHLPSRSRLPGPLAYTATP